MRGAIVVLSGLLIVGMGGGAMALFLFRRGPDGAGALSAEPVVQALVRPRLSDVEALATSVVPLCAAHRPGAGPSAASPAIGTPIVGWPETVGVHVACIFETPPGSGSFSGGGFDDYGDTSVPDGAWSVFGPSGFHIDACGVRHDADCIDYSVSQTDRRVVRIDAMRRLPSGDGWAEVTVILRR